MSACDPDFNSVSLLLAMDGAAGSTTFVDTSPHAFTVTNVGSVIESTAVTPQFESTCGYFPGSWQTNTDAYLSVPIVADGPLDFSQGATLTFEGWIRINAPVNPGFEALLTDLANGTYGNTLLSVNAVGFTGNYQIAMLVANDGFSSYVQAKSAVATPDSNWHHVAGVIDTVNLVAAAWLDGVCGATQTLSAPITYTGQATFGVGDAPALGNPFSGYMQQMRVTKGLARYTPGVNFTPPTAVFGLACGPAPGVPNVIGDTLSAAESALTGAGFAVGTLTTAFSPATLGTITAQSVVGAAAPGTGVNLTVSGAYVPGTQADIESRVNLLLPVGWFTGLTSLKDALVVGIASVFAFIYSLFGYVRQQTRIATATDGFLELIAGDFFGANLPRATAESDPSYRTRIKASLFLERGTRADVIRVITQLTGNAPLIVEPSRPADCGGYGIACGYGVGGRLGSRVHPYQAFITVARGTSASDATLYAAIAAVLPEATIAWVKLTS